MPEEEPRCDGLDEADEAKVGISVGRETEVRNMSFPHTKCSPAALGFAEADPAAGLELSVGEARRPRT